jgi:predicted Zn-dependent peptidase
VCSCQPALGGSFRTVLDNGLTVVTEPEHRSKVVALQLWVQVGSADEAPDEAGLRLGVAAVANERPRR